MKIETLYQKYCSRRFRAAAVEEIEQFQLDIKAKLPEDFIDYLLTYNGGNFRDPAIEFQGTTIDHLTVLYGVNSSESYSDLRIASYTFDDNDPCQLLPFGYTMSGSLLILDLDSGQFGYIYIKRPSITKSSYLADSFSDFITNHVLDESIRS